MTDQKTAACTKAKVYKKQLLFISWTRVSKKKVFRFHISVHITVMKYIRAIDILIVDQSYSIKMVMLPFCMHLLQNGKRLNSNARNHLRRHAVQHMISVFLSYLNFKTNVFLVLKQRPKNLRLVWGVPYIPQTGS